MPVVSVVIPTYNRAHVLERAVRSVLAQTYQDFEIIVVDDGSTDGSADLVGKLRKEDGRITYLRHDSNRGEGAARNTGIRHARGIHIASQDSDDEWLPQKLEKQMRAFESAGPDVGVVYSGEWILRGDEKIYYPPAALAKKEGDIHDILLKGNFVGTPTTLIKRECFQKAGFFDEHIPYLVDYELWLRMSRCYKFKLVDEPLTKGYYSATSQADNYERIMQSTDYILARHAPDFTRDRKFMRCYLRGLAEKAFLNNDFKRGRRYLLKALRADPLNIKYACVFLLSLGGARIYHALISLVRKR